MKNSSKNQNKPLQNKNEKTHQIKENKIEKKDKIIPQQKRPISGSYNVNNNNNTKQINKYEMKNNARRSNNESDYNIYKDGKVGCRIKILNSMTNLPIKNKKNYAMKRFNTEENKNFPEKIQKWKTKNNKINIR